VTKAILISRGLPGAALDVIPPHVNVDYNGFDRALTKPELISRLKGRQGLICQIVDTVDDEVLATEGLRVVCNIAVGYNNIDVDAARRRGIVVTNTPDVLTETTADFAWALLMAAARRVTEADRYVRAGHWKAWDYDALLGHDVHGKTLGLVGFGRIGRAVARRARGFNMRVLYHDTVRADPRAEQEVSASYTPLPDLLGQSDFVSLHAPLLAETRHLLDEQALRTMKKTAIVVNAARGPIVDEAALVRALTEGWIAGAGLDVFENEPHVHPGLLSLNNVVLAPHIGSGSSETRLAMATLAVRNCIAVLDGMPPLTPVTG
jgi:glyoxylate reductase